MITIEQLKDIKDRTDALYRYLGIESKQIEVEEEQLRTQAPGFWDDAKAAELQMKKVKGLLSWIDGYKEVKTLVEEADAAFEFYKEELVSEAEVDEAFVKAASAVEALELKNMLRSEADKMDCVLKINAGAGGTEAQDWAQMLMRMYMRYAETHGYKCSVANLLEGDDAGIKTCTLNIEGPFAYGYLKSENGVHLILQNLRLRKYDFFGNGRHRVSAQISILSDQLRFYLFFEDIASYNPIMRVVGGVVCGTVMHGLVVLRSFGQFGFISFETIYEHPIIVNGAHNLSPFRNPLTLRLLKFIGASDKRTRQFISGNQTVRNGGEEHPHKTALATRGLVIDRGGNVIFRKFHVEIAANRFRVRNHMPRPEMVLVETLVNILQSRLRISGYLLFYHCTECWSLFLLPTR
jgi:hypothetical protein